MYYDKRKYRIDNLIEFIVKDNKLHVIWEKFKGLTKTEEKFLSRLHDEKQDLRDFLSKGIYHGIEIKWFREIPGLG